MSGLGLLKTRLTLKNTKTKAIHIHSKLFEPLAVFQDIARRNEFLSKLKIEVRNLEVVMDEHLSYQKQINEMRISAYLAKSANI